MSNFHSLSIMLTVACFRPPRYAHRRRPPNRTQPQTVKTLSWQTTTSFSCKTRIRQWTRTGRSNRISRRLWRISSAILPMLESGSWKTNVVRFFFIYFNITTHIICYRTGHTRCTTTEEGIKESHDAVQNKR